MLDGFTTESVYFRNIETGETFVWHAGGETPIRYMGASVTKAFHALFIYQQIDAGSINFDSVISGVYAVYEEEFTGTVREALNDSLRVSGTASAFALANHVEELGLRPAYHAFLSEFGINITTHGATGQNYYIEDAGRIALAIFNYIESDAPNAAEFKQHLLAAVDGGKVDSWPSGLHEVNWTPTKRIYSRRYDIASKSGWWNSTVATSIAWHDMAFVYSDSPYILIVMSNVWENTANVRAIGNIFELVNYRYFAGR